MAEKDKGQSRKEGKVPKDSETTKKIGISMPVELRNKKRIKFSNVSRMVGLKSDCREKVTWSGKLPTWSFK